MGVGLSSESEPSEDDSLRSDCLFAASSGVDSLLMFGYCVHTLVWITSLTQLTVQNIKDFQVDRSVESRILI